MNFPLLTHARAFPLFLSRRVSRHNPPRVNFMDHRTVAAVSIAGISLDLLGSLYLAYGLLGGQHGPLRMLTRAVTYSRNRSKNGPCVTC